MSSHGYGDSTRVSNVTPLDMYPVSLSHTSTPPFHPVMEELTLELNTSHRYATAHDHLWAAAKV